MEMIWASNNNLQEENQYKTRCSVDYHNLNSFLKFMKKIMQKCLK